MLQWGGEESSLLHPKKVGALKVRVAKLAESLLVQ